MLVFVAAILFPSAFAFAQAGGEGSQGEPGMRPAEQTQDGGEKNLLDMDLEQLAKAPVVVPSMDIPVTTVAREQSTVGRSPAAVFVITQEMIRRSGATCIPEVLRMAPGLEVAQINSSRWCISARGFNGRFANKLLVLIDGRSVYTPVNSGVYWDVQDVLLEDVERIEVVRGPGGTLWGANAVNGVINILTKSAKDTQGTYVSGGGGTHERFNDAFRHGGKIGENGYYRIYGKYFERGPGVERAGPFDATAQGNDAWCQGRVGFRTDWDVGPGKSDSLTVQGDYYRGSEGDSATADDRKICLDAGCDFYVAKPIDRKELLGVAADCTRHQAHAGDPAATAIVGA